MDAIDRFAAARSGTISQADLTWLWYVLAVVVVAGVAVAVKSHLRKRASIVGAGTVDIEQPQPGAEDEIITEQN